MRLERLIGVAIMVYILAVCGFLPAAPAQRVSPVTVAQSPEPTLLISAGNQNPTGLINIIGSVQDLLALHILLSTETQAVLVDTVTIGFSNRTIDDDLGNESFLNRLRIRLIADQNANGIRDAGEPILGTQEVEAFEDPRTVTFGLAPPVIIPPHNATALIVIVDINSAGTQSAALVPGPGMPPTHGAWPLLLLPLFGMMVYRPRPRHAIWRYLVIIVLIMCCGLALSSCAGDDDGDEFIFVVNLPSNGVTGQGLLLGPEDAIAGVTIRLTPG